MRKWFVVLFFLGAVALGVGMLNHSQVKGIISPSPKAHESLLLPQASNVTFPVTLSIPKLGVNAEVEKVGLDKDNAMDVPKKDMNVAWYELGAKPGQLGNAVFAGHFDKKDGSPAIFAKLDELEKGDEILATDETGNQLKFKVTDKESYKLEEFPLKAVFGESTKARLNLITCEGVFDKSSHLYSHRLVVFAELVN